MSYQNATICENGHVRSYYHVQSEIFCSICGVKTYSYCPVCNASIRGIYDTDGVVVIGKRIYNRPFYCYNCSSPFPWTKKILSNAMEIIEMDNLSETDRELFKFAIPNLIVDTPDTSSAIAKFSKASSHLSDIARPCLRQLLIDVVSETAKKILFPS